MLSPDPTKAYRVSHPNNDASWELVAIEKNAREVYAYWRREKLCRKHDDCLEDDGVARACLRKRQQEAALKKLEAEAAE